MKLSKVVTILGLVFSALSVNAEPYVGASYVIGGLKDTRYDDNVESYLGRIGIGFSEKWAVEARGGTGGTFKVTSSGGSKFDVGPDTYLGGYLVGRLPNTSDYTPYGVLGFTSVSITTERDEETKEISESGFTYGFGLDCALIVKGLHGNFEFMSYVHDENFSFGGFSLGLKYEF